MHKDTFAIKWQSTVHAVALHTCKEHLHCPTLTQPLSVVDSTHVSCPLHDGVQQLEAARG